MRNEFEVSMLSGCLYQFYFYFSLVCRHRRDSTNWSVIWSIEQHRLKSKLEHQILSIETGGFHLIRMKLFLGPFISQYNNSNDGDNWWQRHWVEIPIAENGTDWMSIVHLSSSSLSSLVVAMMIAHMHDVFFFRFVFTIKSFCNCQVFRWQRQRHKTIKS